MRNALGVIISFVAMAVAVFGASVAPWFLFGLDAVLQPGKFQSTGTITAYAVIVGALGAVAAGWLCARITSSHSAVLWLAALCFLAGIGNAFGQSKKPEAGARAPGVTVGEAMAQRKEPAWFTLLMPCIGVAGVLFGGRRV